MLKCSVTTLLCLFLYTATLSGQSVPHGKDFKLDCRLCHNTATWQVEPDSVKFDHNTTALPLTGRHKPLDCRACHTNAVFKGTSAQCFSCHTDPHESGVGFSCEACHTATRWQDNDSFREYHATLQFPLTGIHAGLDCSDCHTQSRYRFSNTPLTCYACHNQAYHTATEPDHVKSGFSTDCSLCHTPNHLTWDSAPYAHQTSFKLSGGHSGVTCSACHTTTYAGTSPECESCHLADYQQTTDPNHPEYGIPQTCATCHQVTSWEAAEFDHLERSGFQLNGAHQTISCTDCHINNQIQGLPRDCYGCHQDDFQTAADPDHVTNQLDHDCILCHSEYQWQPSTFDHALTQFPLAGAHTTLTCLDCHADGYTNTQSDCWSCHEADFTAATDPNHATNNFDHDCTICHTNNTWNPASFDHAATQFPLAGAHAPLTCIDCHADRYTGTPLDCWSCHETDFTATTDPNHQTNIFDHDCTICHTTAGWQPATFDHAATQFPLKGAHAPLTCIDCHADGYSGTPIDCWSCHETDFNAAADPDHAANNFAHDCTLCHTAAGWEPATFNHADSQFPLTGAHAGLDCLACHAVGYTGTSSACFACHESDFTNAQTVDHAAANFSTSCEECHTTTTWRPANWNHDNLYFPINSGEHRGEWNNCTDCHRVETNYNTFSCLDCHEHRKSKMDDEHSGEADYLYNSDSCFNCHPRGDE